jgi:hypothetical protein
VRAHAEEFDRALASVRNLEDFRDMPAERIEPRLRGLAPALRVSALMAPSSAWGRSMSNGAGG